MAKIITDEKKIDELLARGVEEVIVKEHLREALRSGKQLRVKLGIDPTSPAIHLGRAVVLRKLRAFQELGHKVVFIVGDFTAQIGDPSDKLEKRPMLTPEVVSENMKTYAAQAGKIIDLASAEIRHNSEWLKKLGFQEISELAESFSFQQMAARRNFKERKERGEEISLRELLYPLMQGYDSVAVKAGVELGGSDQLFNLKAGRIVQKHYGMAEQDIITTKMIPGTDGEKMSSSRGNVIRITDEPEKMFGQIMAIEDSLMHDYFVLCTSLSLQKIIEMEKENPRDAKLRLAEEIVRLYHGEKNAKSAKENFVNVFSKKKKPQDISLIRIGTKEMKLADLLAETKLASSKSEARRLVLQGGVRINDDKKTNPEEIISLEKEITFQVGKRHFLRVLGK